jgi:hypothetical protein
MQQGDLFAEPRPIPEEKKEPVQEPANTEPAGSRKCQVCGAILLNSPPVPCKEQACYTDLCPVCLLVHEHIELY